MAVIKTKTKFTKSKFTKNKYYTKKKNVSRMTKKKNVMKGGAKGKPLGNGSRRRGSQNPQNLLSRQNKTLYASVNKTRQPQYRVNRFNKIVNYMEGTGKYANTRTRKDRFTENQKQQIRNLNIYGNSENVEKQIRKILVNSQGRSKFAPEAVRELMKQPSYLKSLVNTESQYVNIAPKSLTPLNSLNI